MSDWTPPPAHTVLLDGETLTIEGLAAAAAGAPVALGPAATARIARAADWAASGPALRVLRDKWAWLAGEAPDHRAPQLAREFVVGHCAGVGDPLPPDQVRATLAARIHVFAAGYSGVRPALVERLVAALASPWQAVVPAQGTVGAAGSAVLAGIARVACGFGGQVTDGATCRPTDLPPFELNEKEALSLVNGATFDTAMAALAIFRAERLLATAEAACALSFEVMRADRDCLAAPLHAARRHPGAIGVAHRLRERLSGSELVVARGAPDSFSLRCAPIVLGTARDAIAQARAVVEAELNAAADNPLLVDGEMLEGGNFHGAPIALAMDHLKIALTQVASIAERRIYRLTYGQLSGLPSFLLPGDGINNGLMLAQYTAASLVSECKGLSHPASVDAIPTVQHHEDHVSMATVAARSALHLIELVADVLAIELLCGAQGLDFRLAGEAVVGGQVVAVPPQRPADATRATYDTVRARVPRWRDDRVLHPDLAAVSAAVRAGAFA